MTQRKTSKLVLVVDDDQDIREAISEALEDDGVSSTTASDGKAALECLRNGTKPCVILLDMMMPVMDGWRFRELQRDDPALANIPVIVLTAHADAASTAERMGAAGYLKKPIRLGELYDAVSRFCEESY